MGKWFSISLLVFTAILPITTPLSVSAATNDQVLINEIRLGGDEIGLDDGTKVKEYVTLINLGSSGTSLDGWVLEYAKNPKAGLDGQFCNAASWSGFDNITVATIELSGTIAPGGISQPIGMQLNDSGSGSLRLLDDSDAENVVMQDLVGWGDSAPCKEEMPAKTPTTGKSLFRKLACETALPVDTNANAEDFTADLESKPEQLSGEFIQRCDAPLEDTDCDNVAITEVMPNPAGTDSGHEFIELYNPTDAVLQLQGCGLGAGEDEEFLFPADTELSPGEYWAFYDGVTGIGLINSSGMELAIVTASEEFVQTTYPAGLKDDISWALIEGAWQQTDNVTPNAPNEPMTPEESGGSGDDMGLGPCPVGKFRNPLTNRCKSIALASAFLTPCKPGQTRNPATNRCRSTTLASSTLTPCKPGQERNAATNRCRNINSAGSLKPCGSGEERNPETNRCRKVPEVLSGANPASKEDQSNGMVNYGLLGLVGASAVGYGAFEYRNDFRNKLLSFKARFFPGNSSE